MKIVCIGRNYSEHAAELNNKVPKEPLIFIKPSSAIYEASQYLIPEFTNDLHYECEWVIRIGSTIKSYQGENLMDKIDSMTLGIDFTARDLQRDLKSKGHPWEKAKAFNGSAVVGSSVPFDLKDQKFEMYKNGELVQSADSSDMIFSLPELIKEITKYFSLEKGDLVFTGTPKGVGPVSQGDVLEGYLNGESLFLLKIK